MDCARRYGGGVVIMTSDKVYRHPGTQNVQDARLGGVEPYGGSKACPEVVAEVYAWSLLEPQGISLAALRAGNVVGGGDWAANRLVPDAVRASLSGRPLALRRPQAVRPWQHVLDAVQGLLLVAHHVLERRGEYSAWNVGPDLGETRTVGEIAQVAAASWGNEASGVLDGERQFEEAEVLTIDSGQIRRQLGYHQPWPLESVVRDTM
ncbi:MAG: NAD-dependent epimerase/dehydratase family protein [Reyranellaceae bacterium]